MIIKSWGDPSGNCKQDFKQMKKKRIILLSISVLLGLGLIGFLLPDSGSSSQKTFKLRRADFEIVVQSKGELKGEEVVLITLPSELTRRELGLWRLEIEDLVPEGTIVEKGAYVARINRQAIEEAMKNNKNRLDEREARLKDARIDSSIQLNAAREAIQREKLNLQDKKYDLDLAVYESEAYQRQMEIAYNKAKRNLEKVQRDLKLNQISLAVRVRREEKRYNWYLELDKKYEEALNAIEIKAPKKGMVMYARRRNGQKIKIGDHVNMWEPEIASLPDLSQMISESFVREIDIAKIKKGDSVEIVVDALPEKVYSGKVAHIANVGQEIAGVDTKVFKVSIRLDHSDNDLKPYMTTNNQIFSATYKDTLIVPLKYVFSANGFQFVYLKEGAEIYRQQVNLGIENEEAAIIHSGVSSGDIILCKQPRDTSEIEFRKL